MPGERRQQDHELDEDPALTGLGGRLAFVIAAAGFEGGAKAIAVWRRQDDGPVCVAPQHEDIARTVGGLPDAAEPVVAEVADAVARQRGSRGSTAVTEPGLFNRDHGGEIEAVVAAERRGCGGDLKPVVFDAELDDLRRPHQPHGKERGQHHHQGQRQTEGDLKPALEPRRTKDHGIGLCAVHLCSSTVAHSPGFRPGRGGTDRAGRG